MSGVFVEDLGEVVQQKASLAYLLEVDASGGRKTVVSEWLMGALRVLARARNGAVVPVIQSAGSVIASVGAARPGGGRGLSAETLDAMGAFVVWQLIARRAR